MKKIFFLFTIVSVILITGCSTYNNFKKEDGKIKILTTLFPQYDFARQIAGDKADVALLLTPGMESHSFDLAPSDIIKISNSDLFIYTGKYMENWVDTVIDSLDDNSVTILDVSKGITLKENHEEEHDEEEEHEDGLDPHIWTSPKNAKIMVKNILAELVKIDPDNSYYYNENAEKYLSELDLLDDQFEEIVSSSKRKKMVFATRFAFFYFASDYNLDYVSAYDSCSHESEPSLKTITEIIEEIKNDNVPVIYYQELSSTAVADSISSESGATPLLFHSAHNVTKKEFTSGVTYLSIMKQNAENLRIGLN